MRQLLAMIALAPLLALAAPATAAAQDEISLLPLAPQFAVCASGTGELGVRVEVRTLAESSVRAPLALVVAVAGSDLPADLATPIRAQNMSTVSELELTPELGFPAGVAFTACVSNPSGNPVINVGIRVVPLMGSPAAPLRTSVGSGCPSVELRKQFATRRQELEFNLRRRFVLALAASQGVPVTLRSGLQFSALPPDQSNEAIKIRKSVEGFARKQGIECAVTRTLLDPLSCSRALRDRLVELDRIAQEAVEFLNQVGADLRANRSEFARCQQSKDPETVAILKMRNRALMAQEGASSLFAGPKRALLEGRDQLVELRCASPRFQTCQAVLTGTLSTPPGPEANTSLLQ